MSRDDLRRVARGRADRELWSGPYLQAVLAMFAGAYRLSKRQIRQVSAELFSLRISVGMISKLERRSAAVLEAPYIELAVAVHHAKRMLTIVATCRQQGRNVPDDLTTCFEANGRGQALPALLPVANVESDAA